MQQIITAKLKLLTTPEQHHALRQTQLAYRDALNYVSQYAFEHGKTSNTKRLQKGTYYDIRAEFKLPSEMTNNVSYHSRPSSDELIITPLNGRSLNCRVSLRTKLHWQAQ